MAPSQYFIYPLNDTASLIVFVIALYEVFMVVLRESTENEALQMVAAMQKSKIVNINEHIAMNAYRLSLKYNLSKAGSVIRV